VNRLSVSECAQCGAEMIAPKWSEHLSDQCVRNVWSCEACGYQFEDLVYLSAQATDSLHY
jgi:ribosomal protein L37AE/L43A